MKDHPKVSLIIRTKNEERWITPCLRAVFDQDFKDFEVIIVDNESTDKTVEKAKTFDVEITHIQDFLPGKALNQGIRNSKGEFLAFLSGHCIPKDRKWLSNLFRNFDDPTVAGVYGKQEPMPFSSDFDKRDLLITFGLDKKIQIKDSFFHNANSMIRRDLWNEVPFDEEVTNIEDRIWAKEVLERGFKIIYEPEASVFHYHGIHQEKDRERCRNVVRILESLDLHKKESVMDIKGLDIHALIPWRGEMKLLKGKPLISYTIKNALNSKYVKTAIVLTDDQKVKSYSEKEGAIVPFLREKTYSEEHIDIETVLEYSLNKLEDLKIYPDLLVILEPTYPFRPKGLIDELIEHLISEGIDTAIPGFSEYGSHWIKKDGFLERIDEGDIPRTLKKPIIRGLRGLACVTYPGVIRQHTTYGEKVGIVKVDDPRCEIEVRDEWGIELAEDIIEDFLKDN